MKGSSISTSIIIHQATFYIDSTSTFHTTVRIHQDSLSDHCLPSVQQIQRQKRFAITRSQTGSLLLRKNEFLRLATRNLAMDPASMEGVNFHISSYFYVKEGGWTCSHPAQLSSCSLRRDASEKSRWACFACARRGEGRMTPLHFFRTSSEQLEHFFLNDATDSMWDFARKGSELGVTASELCCGDHWQGLAHHSSSYGPANELGTHCSPLTSTWSFQVGH